MKLISSLFIFLFITIDLYAQSSFEVYLNNSTSTQSCNLTAQQLNCSINELFLNYEDLIGGVSPAQFCQINNITAHPNVSSCTSAPGNKVAINITLNFAIKITGNIKLSIYAKKTNSSLGEFIELTIDGISMSSSYQEIPALSNLNVDGNGFYEPISLDPTTINVPMTLVFSSLGDGSFESDLFNSISLFIESKEIL